MPSWNASLSVGVETVDAQHQELLARADALLDAMRAGRSRAQVTPLLGFLRDYCREHFASEVALMRKVAYPELEDHAAQHASFTTRLACIEDDFQTFGPTTAIAAAVHELLCVRFVKHILEVDLAFASHLHCLTQP
ncbi:MAG TPA: bacteriohemerythrin [Anaeromyxobacteraceae bacterium]|nr:bacteriohemerythrin [Anaeromyxobacteraceae bacterium]